MTPSFTVTVTHCPTGEKVHIDSTLARTTGKALDNALRVMRSRLFAFKHEVHRSLDIVADYSLADSDPWGAEVDLMQIRTLTPNKSY